MADPRFFSKAGPFTAGEIAGVIGAELHPADAAEREFSDIGALSDAGPEAISFLDNTKYRAALAETRAGGVVLHPDFAEEAPAGAVRFVTTTPYRAFALAARHFYPAPAAEPGVHATACVAEDAVIGEGTCVEAGAVVGAGAEIGADCRIGANAVIDYGVVVGAGTHVGAGAYLGFCRVGRDCNIHPGVRIGTRGFGFSMDGGEYLDVPQLGRVIVGDGVEVGANSCIDRGMGPDTVVGSGTKIDNLVQIGHNVRIGERCVLVGQCGLAGSAVLEDYVICAAQSGITGHVTVGRGAQVAGRSGVTRDIAPGEKVGGMPAVPLRQWQRQQVALARLVERGKTNNK